MKYLLAVFTFVSGMYFAAWLGQNVTPTEVGLTLNGLCGFTAGVAAMTLALGGER